MRKIGIGSRLLALLLVLAMALPMMPLTAYAAVGDIATGDDGNNSLGDTGLVNDYIDTYDTISWPIRIYDFLNDGMLFEFANAAYTGDISDLRGGAYGGGTSMPLMINEAAGSVIGADYTIDSTFDEFAFINIGSDSAYANNLDTSAEKAGEVAYSEVVAKNFKDPGYMHLEYVLDQNGDNTKSYVWVSNFARDNTKYYTGNSVRYAVIVYRTNEAYVPHYARFYLAVSDSSYSTDYSYHSGYIDISNVSGNTGYGKINTEDFTVPKSTEWNYVVVDLKKGDAATYWNNFAASERVAGIGLCFPLAKLGETMDVSHIAYFDTEFEAIEFGKDAVAFDKDPGEYLNAHTEYSSTGNPHPGTVSNNGWDFTTSDSSAWSSNTIAEWKGSGSYGGFTVTSKGSGPMYLNVTNSDSYRDSAYIWKSSSYATANDTENYADIKYVTLVYRTHNINNPKIGFWLEDGETGTWESCKTENSDVAITGSEQTWVYVTYDLTALDDIESFSGSVDTFNRIGIKFPGFTSSSQSMDIAFVDYFDSKTKADAFGTAAAAYMNNPGGSYTTAQKRWYTGNNVSFGMLYANDGGGWADDGYRGGANNDPNGYFNYQIGAFKYNDAENEVINGIREDAADMGYPVSDTMWLLTWALINYEGDKDSNGKKYYDMSNLDLGYKLYNQFYEGVMTAGLLEAGLTTVTDQDGNVYRVPNYKEDTVAYIAYLLRDALAVGKTDASGNYLYNFVAGTANGEQYGYDASGKAYDLASALRARLGYTFPNGSNGGGKATYTAKIGTYADTLAKADSLIGAYMEVKDNITTFMDAAYYLLMNQFVADSYNQAQDEYHYLVMAKGTLETNNKTAYVFDAGFTTGKLSETANTDAYRNASQSAVNYDTTKGTISLISANSKDQVYFQGAASTTRFPFLPVTHSTGAYAGETKSPYFHDDGNGVMGITKEGATFVNRNYNYAMVSNGEFVYHAEDGLFFDFEGDDDVWLFLNNELVVDVGSAHSITKVYMDVNDYVVWAQDELSVLDGFTHTYADAASGSDITLNYSAGMSDAKFKILIKAFYDAGKASGYSSYADFEAVLLRAHHLNLVDGAAYNFDFYYMERHGWGANCRIATNIVVTDPTMKTDKTAYQDTDGDKTLDEIPYNGLVNDSKPIKYQFALTNEGNTKLYKMSFKDANIGLELTYDEGLTTFGVPVVTTFATTGTSTPVSLTGLDGVMNLDGKVYYLSADGTITWTETILDDYGEVVSVETKTATSLDLAAGTHSLLLYQTNSRVLFNDSYAKVNIGGVADNSANTLNPEASGGVYTLTAGKVNRLLVEGIRVSDANGGALDVSDLTITVDGFTSEENYNAYLEQMEAGNTAKAESYKIDTITIELNTNEELKEFLTYLTDPAHQTQETDREGNTGVYNGAGLWRHATVTISGFYYTLNEEQRAAGEFNNTVYTFAFGTMTTDKELKGQDTHRVHSVGASYYQWAGHKLTVDAEKMYSDLDYTFFVQKEENNVVVTIDKEVAYGDVSFSLCDPAGESATYDYVTLSGSTFYINYPSAGEYTFYVLMKTDLDGDSDSTKGNAVGESCVAPITVYVTDVEDSVYVLDYGLTTEDLNADGILFRNDQLRGEYGTDMAKLMNVGSTAPSYVERLNRISFTKLGLYDGGDIKVEDGHFNIDMAIDAESGKKISYNSYTKTYSLTDAGTMKIHLSADEIPEYWTDVYLYFWYDDGTDNDWPGSKMEKQSDGSYVVDIPGDVSNIIINNTPAAGTMTVTIAKDYVTEKLGSDVYLYYWGGANGPSWSDSPAMQKQDDGSYTLTIPSDMTGAVIHNGNGTQTIDLKISRFSDNLIRLTGETDDGKLVATSSASSVTSQTVDLFVTPGMTNYIQLTGAADGDKLKASVTTNTEDVTVSVKAPADWKDVRVYYWGSVEQIDYYGIGLEDTDGDGWYTGKIPGDASNIIVHDGNNDYRKTYDLTITSGLEPWIVVDDNYSNSYTEGADNHTVYQYNARITYSDNTFTVCAGVSAVSGWGTPYLYYWYSDGTSTEITWPGEQMTYNSETGRYTYEVPVGVHNVIITNEGGTKQTENLLLGDFAAGSHADIDVQNAMASGKYMAVVKEESISFTPDDFMDSAYRMWMAITVHAVNTVPTAVTNAGSGTININKEVQMYKQITVLPATVVYYEDDFPAIHYAVDPTADGAASAGNVFTRIGYSDDKTQSVDQDENYGYDDTYADSANDTMSAGTLTTVKIGDNKTVAYFTFKGTGFELISRTNAEDSATIKVKVYKSGDVTNGVPNAGASYVKSMSVITEFDQDANNNPGGSEAIYQVPVIRVDGMALDTYTVIITGVPAGNYDDNGNYTGTRDTYLYVDGLRILQPLGASNDNYNAGENNATFAELRDLIADGEMGFATSVTASGSSFSVSTGTVTWTENRVGELSDGTEYTGNKVNSVNDYLLLGPNNEVYMDNAAKNALVFYVKETASTTDTAELQIAVSAIDRGLFYGGESTGMYAVVQLGVFVNGSYTWENVARVKTGTEMYYDIPYTKCPVTDKGYQVVLRVITGTTSDNAANIPAMAAFASVKYNGLTIEDMGAEPATMRYGEYGLEIYDAESGKWYGLEYVHPETRVLYRYNATDSVWQKYDENQKIWVDTDEDSVDIDVLESVNAYPAFQALSAQMAADDGSYVPSEPSEPEQTEPADPELFDISYASMTMGNSLAINFAFDKNAVSDWSGCYARIVKTYADGREDVSVTVPWAEWKSTTINDEAYCYVTFNGIAAKEMADEVRVTIYNADGEAVSNTWTDSVRAQSMRALEKVSGLEATMIVDMLNYGAAAQEYFGYNTADLANSQLSDAQKALASQASDCVNNRTSSGRFVASTVVLKSNIQLMFAFRDVDESMYAEVTYTNHRGVEKTVTIGGASFGSNNGCATVTVDALVVADARQDVTCRVYDASGNLVASVTDSVASYTARSNGDELFVRMMQYSDSAYAFFHS